MAKKKKWCKQTVNRSRIIEKDLDQSTCRVNHNVDPSQVLQKNNNPVCNYLSLIADYLGGAVSRKESSLSLRIKNISVSIPSEMHFCQ